jgi:hypothetical protein
MGSGEKQRRIKATLEVIELIENAVAYVTTHRFTTRPFQRGRVRDAVADILGIGSATVARVESGALKRNPAQPAEKRAAKKSRHGPPPLEQVAKRIKVGDDAGRDIVDACRDIIAEVNRRDPPQACYVGLVVRELYLYERHPAHMRQLDALYLSWLERLQRPSSRVGRTRSSRRRGGMYQMKGGMRILNE